MVDKFVRPAPGFNFKDYVGTLLREEHNSRVRRIGTSIHSSEPIDAIDQYRIIQIIETVNTDSISMLKAQGLEACRYLPNRFSALVCGPELRGVFDIDIQRPVLVEMRIVKVP